MRKWKEGQKEERKWNKGRKEMGGNGKKEGHVRKQCKEGRMEGWN